MSLTVLSCLPVGGSSWDLGHPQSRRRKDGFSKETTRLGLNPSSPCVPIRRSRKRCTGSKICQARVAREDDRDVFGSYEG